MPKKISRALALDLINAIYPDKFASIEDMLREAPIGIVQFFLIYSNNINLKIKGEFSIRELVLQRCDLNKEEFSLFISALQRQNYYGFATRTSTGLSIMENILVAHSSIPQFEGKIESMIAAGIRVTPKTLKVACEHLGPGCYTVIKTLCHVLNTVPYRSAIKIAADRAVREGNNVFSCSLAAEIISALLSSITTYTRFSVEIPPDIIAVMDQTGFPEYSVLWGIDINGKRITEVFSESTCRTCMSSIKSLLDFFVAGKIDSITFTDIITSYMEKLSSEHARTLATEAYKLYLHPRVSFDPLAGKVLLSKIEEYVDLASISPSPRPEAIKAMPVVANPDTVVIGRRVSAGDALAAPALRYHTRRASEPDKEYRKGKLPPRHPDRNARKHKVEHTRREPYYKYTPPAMRPGLKPSRRRAYSGSPAGLMDGEHERIIDAGEEEIKGVTRFPPIAPITPGRKVRKYKA